MLGKSVGFWFQKSFANPEESSRFMRNRPGEQIWNGGCIVFKETTTKREGLVIGVVVKKYGFSKNSFINGLFKTDHFFILFCGSIW